MFTGIIQNVGRIERKGRKGPCVEFQIKSPLAKSMKLGDSVSVNGVCLTVAAKNGTSFKVDAVPETLQATNLGKLVSGSAVNLEPAMKASDRLGGHFVTGHVDGVGTILKTAREGRYLTLKIAASADIIRHLVLKGSVAVDGISLTVQRVAQKDFSFAVIPFTFEHTNLKHRKTGDKVNIETDLLAKYLEKQISPKTKSRDSLTVSFLRSQGF